MTKNVYCCCFTAICKRWQNVITTKKFINAMKWHKASTHHQQNTKEMTAVLTGHLLGDLECLVLTEAAWKKKRKTPLVQHVAEQHTTHQYQHLQHVIITHIRNFNQQNQLFHSQSCLDTVGVGKSTHSAKSRTPAIYKDLWYSLTYNNHRYWPVK